MHNCVDLSRFEPDLLSREEARRRLGLGSSEPVFGVVAQITPWKAQDDAIRIASELRRDHPVFRRRRFFEGKPIRVRFIWSGVTTPTPRWEQAFSEDGGETWETNWITDFTRPDADT